VIRAAAHRDHFSLFARVTPATPLRYQYRVADIVAIF
jgi:hypothetical protein